MMKFVRDALSELLQSIYHRHFAYLDDAVRDCAHLDDASRERCGTSTASCKPNQHVAPEYHGTASSECEDKRDVAPQLPHSNIINFLHLNITKCIV